MDPDNQIKKIIRNSEDEIQIGLSQAGLHAYLSIVVTRSDHSFTVNEVLYLLENEGIVYGVNEARIAKLIDQVNTRAGHVKNELIASGKDPVDGKDAEITYYFKTSKNIEVHADEKGNVDHKNLKIVNNVNEGDLLAVKTPAVAAKTGLNIYGHVVTPSKVYDADLVVGKNIRLSEDRLKCYASRNGHVSLNGNRIRVESIFVVPHDVDLNCGNIDFNGSILVHGNVLTGFTLNAQKNIEVEGTVEGATLIAGGNIYIHGGIKGHQKGLIQCQGDLFTSFAESANLICTGNLTVQASLINSRVNCSSKVVVQSKHGSIMGGETQASRGMKVNNIGSRLGVTTHIIIGDKPLIRQQISAVVDQIQKTGQEMKRFHEAAKKVKPLIQVLFRLPPEKRNRVEQLIRNHKTMLARLQELNEKKNCLDTIYKRPCDAILKAIGTVHPNVVITIGHSNATMTMPFSNSRFRENPYDQSIEPLPLPEE